MARTTELTRPTTSVVPSATGGDGHGLRARGLNKSFTDSSGEVVRAVRDVDLDIPPGEFWVLLGPSGCGKTTLLRCLAGLEEPESGSIEIGGVTTYDERRKVPAEQRRVGMVFQSYALWPHMTVAQNIAFPLNSVKGRSRAEKQRDRKRVHDLLDVMGLTGKGDRKISQLSGGQQQRVALARALAVGNEVVLFDEPLSNIDAKVREQLRIELLRMQRDLGFTAVYVTHDQAEAMELADRVAVMRQGEIVQLGTAEDIYREPATAYVAEFIGTSNLLPATTYSARSDGGLDVSTDAGPVVVARRGGGDLTDGVVATRAHDWWISAERPADPTNAWQGTLRSVRYMGTYLEFIVELGDRPVRVWAGPGSPERGLPENAPVWVGFAAAHARLVGR
jgi:ABC-type Fe3+/spermidine/putrescine transport system ATPase subunit